MTKKNKNSGHRERLRNKFMKSGLSGLHDYEQIELLLTYAVPVKDVKPAGKSLLKKFKNLSGVLDADIDQIVEVKGVGNSCAILLKLVRSFMTHYSEEKMLSGDILGSPEKVYEFAKLRIGANIDESILVIYLNAKNRVISYDLISEGSVDSVVVYPRKIMKMALRNNASGLIMVHNHPSGDTEPSSSDRELTAELKKISDSMDIRLLDHIIVSKTGYYSFSKEGIMK